MKRCKSCGVETEIVTLGDIKLGCADCGSTEGFVDYDNPQLDKLMRHLRWYDGK